MMAWMGFLAGLVIGALFGTVITCVIVISKEGDA